MARLPCGGKKRARGIPGALGQAGKGLSLQHGVGEARHPLS